MSFLQKIKNMFRKGAVAIGAGRELTSILDHPKINMDQNEHERIKASLAYYRGFTERSDNKLANVNMAKKIASEYAKIMFNEQVEITIGKKKEHGQEAPSDADEWIQNVFKHSEFKKNLSKYLEPGMALGGLVVRPYYNADSKKIEFSWALANAFYPLESNTNKISSCAIPFKTIKTHGEKTYYYTLLEFHEWRNGEYWLANELYKSDRADTVGNQVPLSALEKYEKLEPEARCEGFTRPQFSYFKTAGFNNIAPHSPLGVGIYDNAKKSLDRLSKSLDSFDREIDVGQRRVAFPESMLDGVVDKSTGEYKLTFDPKDEFFVIVPGTDSSQFKIEDLTSDIRTEQYVGAINHRLRILEMEVGLSTGTFVFDGLGVRSSNKTATEVVSENSQTYQSRNMQNTELEEFIKDVVLSIYELGATIEEKSVRFTGKEPSREDIAINFDDGVFLNKESESTYYRELYNDGLIPGWFANEKILSIPKNKARELYTDAQIGVVDATAKTTEGTGFEDFEE